MRNPPFCVSEINGADQPRGITAQLISAFVLQSPKYDISSLYLSSVAAQSDLFRTWSETAKIGFLTTRLN